MNFQNILVGNFSLFWVVKLPTNVKKLVFVSFQLMHTGWEIEATPRHRIVNGWVLQENVTRINVEKEYPYMQLMETVRDI